MYFGVGKWDENKKSQAASQRIKVLLYVFSSTSRALKRRSGVTPSRREASLRGEMVTL